MKTRDARSLPAIAQQDLRHKAIKAVIGGTKQVEAAELFGVTRQAIGRWVKAYRQGGFKALKVRKQGRPKGGSLLPWPSLSLPGPPPHRGRESLFPAIGRARILPPGSLGKNARLATHAAFAGSLSSQTKKPSSSLNHPLWDIRSYCTIGIGFFKTRSARSWDLP